MRIFSSKVVVTRAVQSTKHPDTHYLDMVTVDGDTFNVSTKLFSPEQIQSLVLTPCQLEGELRIGKYDTRVTFELTSALLKPLAAVSPVVK